MKSEKGFTLVELIAVIVVLAIIALIAVPAVSNYLYDAEDSYYSATESSLLASARDYFSDYHTLLPKNDGDVRELPIQELVDDGYIDEIKNNEDQKCDGTVYVKRLGNRDYTYCIVLKCADKVKKNTCTGGEEEDSGLKEYAILHKDSITVPQCTTYQEMLASVEEVYKHNNKLVGKIVKSGTEIPLQNNGQDILVYPDESTLNLNIVGSYKLNYEYSGAQSVKTNIHVNDVEKPNVSNFKITFTLGSKNGSSYECDSDTCPWVNQNVVIKFEGTDITTLHNCGKPGSGITQFFYKLDGVTASGATLKTDYRPVTGYSIGNGKFAGYVKVPENEFSGKIYYNVVDKSGNYAYDIGSEPYRYLKIDTIKPTITIKGLRQDNNNEVASGTWVNSKLKFTFTETSGISGHKEYYCFDNNNTCTPTASSTAIVNNAVTRNEVGNYYIRHITISNAGTKSDVKSYNGKVDLIPPTCVSTGGGVWTNQTVTITGVCSDTGGSECTGNATNSYSSQQHSYNQSPGTVYDHANNSVACPADREIKIDKTAPSCHSVSSHNSGWTNVNVTVTGTCDGDTGGSGCSSSVATKTISSTFDGWVSPGTIYDIAGNGTTCDSKQVRVDKTDPFYYFYMNGTVSGIKCLDNESGYYSGNYEVSMTKPSTAMSTTCKDVAGNTVAASRTYTYSCSGSVKCTKQVETNALRYTCQATYTLGGLTCSTSLCNSQCATRDYISATSSYGYGSTMYCNCYTAYFCNSGTLSGTKCVSTDTKPYACTDEVNYQAYCASGYEFSSQDCSCKWS